MRFFSPVNSSLIAHWANYFCQNGKVKKEGVAECRRVRDNLRSQGRIVSYNLIQSSNCLFLLLQSRPLC